MGRATRVVEGCTGTAGERVSENAVVSRPMREAISRAMSKLRSGGMRSVRAGEGCEPSEGRLKPGRTQKGRVLLRGSA
eukprot:2845625-Pleurochrysis_carterae.AAC.1